MIVKISNNVSLRYFPYFTEDVKFEEGVHKKFMLKCQQVVKNSESVLITNKNNIVPDLKIEYAQEKRRKKVLFSANRQDLIKYTEKYDDIFDIYPMESIDFKPIDFVIDDNYKWVVFTSKRAVEFFLARVKIRYFCDKKIAAIGSKTAEVLKSRGLYMNFVPEKFYSADAAEFLKDKEDVAVISAKKHTHAYDDMENIQVIPVYENVIPKNIYNFDYDIDFDYGLFSAPSTFWHIKEVFGDKIIKRIKNIIAIGETTKDYIESCGYKTDIPEKSTFDDMFLYLKDREKL